MPQSSCPYKGLVPYGEEDAPYFFGRDRERRLISSALRGSRLTVLYGESGAGKSSVLAAGVAHDLQDDPDYALVLFRNWLDDPITRLLSTIRTILSKLPGFIPNGGGAKPGNVNVLLQGWAESTKRTLLIVLDQFEDYFQYHPGEQGSGTIAEELPRLLNQSDLPVNFLFALREDALGMLDRFKGMIPSLFDNLVRVEHLSKKAAKEAIIEPLNRFNDDFRQGKLAGRADKLHPIEIDPTLATSVVEQIIAAQGGERPLVQAAYLQLVMSRWWEHDISKGSPKLLADTLNELGGVKTIVERYVEDTMDKLTPEHKELAAEAFRFMVTPTGRKIAQTVSELGGSTYVGEKVSRAMLEDLLDKLHKARLLTSVPPPRGSQPDERAYEFAHDVVAMAAFDWRKEFRQTQELAAAKKKEEEARRRAEDQEQQARRLRQALRRAQRGEAVARTRELVSSSLVNLDVDPELSVLIAAEALVAAWRSARSVIREAEEQLRRSIAASHVKLTLRVGEEFGITALDWSQDGNRLAIVNSDRIRRVWDAKTGKELRASRTDSKRAATDVWHPDLRQQAMFRKITAKVRKIGRSIQLRQFRLKFAWSPDRKRLATSTHDNTARVWEISSGKELLILTGHSSRVLSLAWSPDGKRLATGSDDNSAKLWDIRTGKELHTLKGHAGRILSVAWSGDGKRLATGSNDRTTRVWDAETAEELRILKGHSQAVNRIAWSPDGKRLATYGDETVKIWDVDVSQYHGGAVTSLAWSLDGKRLAIGSDFTAKVRDVESGQELLCLSGHTLDVSSVSWSPDGRCLATGSWDGTAKLWDAHTGELLRNLKGPPSKKGRVWNVAWSPDGKHLATADGLLRVWDCETGQELPSFRNTERTVGVAWSPDGRFLATVTGENVKLWDARARKKLRVFGHTRWYTKESVSYAKGSVFGVAWSPDGRHLATGNLDGPARIWDTKSGRRLRTLGGAGGRVYTVAWGAGGKVYTVAWSPDGKRLATGNDDHTAQVWDAGKGKQLLILYGNRRPVGSVAWSPDGKRLATGSWDGTVQIHAMDIHDLMAIAREHITTHPSETGCKKYLHLDKCPPVAELRLK